MLLHMLAPRSMSESLSSGPSILILRRQSNILIFKRLHKGVFNLTTVKNVRFKLAVLNGVLRPRDAMHDHWGSTAHVPGKAQWFDDPSLSPGCYRQTGSVTSWQSISQRINQVPAPLLPFIDDHTLPNSYEIRRTVSVLGVCWTSSVVCMCENDLSTCLSCITCETHVFSKSLMLSRN